MYNAFKFKKDQKLKQIEAAKPRPLKDTNPELAARRTQRMCDNANQRRQKWINRINFEEDGEGKLSNTFTLGVNNGNFVALVVEGIGNDSLAYRTSFY